MSEITDFAQGYQLARKEMADKDAEIERLREDRDAAETEVQLFRSLLTRAADALEGQSLSILEKKLVTELRKAAE